MPTRPGQSPQSTNSRESLLTAWLERHSPSIRMLGGKSPNLVRKRLRALVGDTAGVFDDIHPLVHRSGKRGKIGWPSEPISPTGNAIERFNELLDRLGPVALQIVRQGKAALADPALRQRLVDQGVPEGRGNGQVAWLTALDRGGERLITRMGEEVGNRAAAAAPDSAASLLQIAQDPAVLQAALEAFLADALHSASIMAQAIEDHEVQDLWLVGDDGEIEPFEMHDHGDGRSAEIIAAARELCTSQCGVADSSRRRVSPAEYEATLHRMLAKWAEDDAGSSRSKEVAVLDWHARSRFAHTLIHPDFFLFVHEPSGPGEALSSWRAIYERFKTEAIPALQKMAQGKSVLQPADQQDLAQDAIVAKLATVKHKFRDAYVDPDREPADWDHVLRNASTLEGVGAFFGDDVVVPGDDEDGWSPTTDRDSPVDADYWLTRDLHLTQTPEYQRLLSNPRRRREPYASYDDLVYFSRVLLGAADDEVGLHARARHLTAQEVKAADTWIAANLEPLLRQRYRAIPPRRRVNREPSGARSLAPGIDLEEVVLADRPANASPEEWAWVALVVGHAFERATIVVYGRRAIELRGDRDA